MRRYLIISILAGKFAFKRRRWVRSGPLAVRGLILATDLALALFHNIIQFLSTFVLNFSATNSELVLFSA